MPEPGEMVTTTRIFGVDSIIQTLGGLTAAFEAFRKEVLGKMTSVEGQVEETATRMQGAIANVAADVQGLKDDLAAVNTDIQGQVDAAVGQRLQAVVDRFGPLADQLQAVADSTPDKETPAEPGTPDTPQPPVDEPVPGEGTPQDPNA
jgi:hypothetical protein